VLDGLSRREHFTSDDHYVFATITGEALGYDATMKAFRRARDAAGLTSPSTARPRADLS
jgi:hypothetical protein